MWPSNRGRRKTDDKITDTVVYDQIGGNSKESNLVMLYDEVNLLLFEKPRSKIKVKKV